MAVSENEPQIEFDAFRKRRYNATLIERIDCHENSARFRVLPDDQRQQNTGSGPERIQFEKYW